MKLLKKKTIFTSLILALTLCLSFLLPSFINSKNLIFTRDINVNEIGTLSYEEKADKIQNMFENVSTKTEGNLSYFSGDISFTQIDFLSTEYEDCDIVKNYQSIIDNDTSEIEISTSLIVDNIIIDNQSLSLKTEYDEYTDSLFVYDDDGNKIDIISELSSDNLDECLALTLLISALTIKQIAAIVVVSAISLVVIANAEQIATDISILVNGVKDGVISFWDRIKLACGKITAIALSGTIAITQLIALELYETAKNRKDQYLLCGTITGNGFIPVKYKFTNYENARNWIKKGGSVWSPFSTTATKAVEGAGYVPGIVQQNTSYSYRAERHGISLSVNNILYDFGFYHYHALRKGTLSKAPSIHSFFGLPFEGKPIG